jgi:hypothetical protein
MNAVVRIALRALLAVAVFGVLITSVCFCWFYFYSGDIPHFSELAELAPDSAETVPDRCSGTPIQVIPSASVGKNLRNALRAAEGLNDEILEFADEDVEAIPVGVQSRSSDAKKIYV